jgi:diguanylate cyclase (GGDEF)-like protein
MIAPPFPNDETRRIEALDSLGMLFSPSEARFDRITALATRLLDVPIALVSLVGAQCQWFKSKQGLDASETPRSVSFCGHAILQDETLIVPDAALDPRFADNPLVVGDPFIRFYAGQPLKAPDGSKLGTLCVIDRRPRRLTPDQVATLRDLAAIVESELQVSALSHVQQKLIAERDELERRSMLDGFTHCWNRPAIMDILGREVSRATRDNVSTGVLLLDIDRFKPINDTHGHVVGDAVILEVAQRMRASVRPYDAIGRYGGDEFLVVLSDCDATTAQLVAERIRGSLASRPVHTPAGPLQVTLSLGLHIEPPQGNRSPIDLVALADQELYRAKAGGRNRVAGGNQSPASPGAPEAPRANPPGTAVAPVVRLRKSPALRKRA